jgi:hypothetical protein
MQAQSKIRPQFIACGKIFFTLLRMQMSSASLSIANSSYNTIIIIIMNIVLCIFVSSTSSSVNCLRVTFDVSSALLVSVGNIG